MTFWSERTRRAMGGIFISTIHPLEGKERNKLHNSALDVKEEEEEEEDNKNCGISSARLRALNSLLSQFYTGWSFFFFLTNSRKRRTNTIWYRDRRRQETDIKRLLLFLCVVLLLVFLVYKCPRHCGRAAGAARQCLIWIWRPPKKGRRKMTRDWCVYIRHSGMWKCTATDKSFRRPDSKRLTSLLHLTLQRSRAVPCRAVGLSAGSDDQWQRHVPPSKPFNQCYIHVGREERTVLCTRGVCVCGVFKEKRKERADIFITHQLLYWRLSAVFKRKKRNLSRNDTGGI